MLNKIIPLSIICTLLCSCSIHHSQPSSHVNNPLCARVVQKLGHGAVINNTPSHRVVNTADRARLLKQYNQLGCHIGSDNRYAYPTDTLDINTQANQLQPHEKARAKQ